MCVVVLGLLVHLGRSKRCCEVAINNVVFQDWSAGVDVPTVTFLPDIPKINCEAGLQFCSSTDQSKTLYIVQNNL